MGNILGEEKTMKQVLREQKRMVDRAVRSLEQERTKAKASEKKLIADMRKAAAENQVKSVHVLARDLVRVRRHGEKFLQLQAQLRAVSLQMQTMASTQALTDSLKSATRAMRVMNAQMRLPALQRIMQDFARQTEALNMGQEAVGEMLDDAMDTEGEAEAEEAAVVAQVLDEVGIAVGAGLVDVPQQQHQQQTQQQTEAAGAKGEARSVEARLGNLGK